MKKHTKIVATISDNRCDIKFLRELYRKGMNVVRINTAHQTPEGSKKVIENTRKVSEKIAVLVDTKGPEIRTNEQDKAFELKKGQLIDIKGKKGAKSNLEKVYVNYNDFVDDVPLGQSILIDDGELELKVVEKQKTKLVCKVMNNATIKPRKSVNVPGVHLNLPSVSKKDREYIKFAIDNNLDFIAHSFVRNKNDILAVQRILDKHKSPIKIIAKIENREGVENIDEILDYAYGIMVARGDLGIEIPAEKIPAIQRYLKDKCKARKKPVIVATQMLHSMIKNPRPTRAEVSDVASAIYRETDAVMLSGETAYGDYPVEAVETMAKIALEIESSREVQDNTPAVSIDNDIAVFLAESAAKAMQRLPIKAILLDTLSGRTARYMSAFRGKIPVYAVCYQKHVMRQLALSYGIIADHFEPRNNTDEFRKDALSFLQRKKCFKKKDLVAIIGGSFGPSAGASFLEVNTVANLMDPEVPKKMGMLTTHAESKEIT